MAKTRPSLGGIFRLKGKNESKIKLTGMSTYGDQNPAPSATRDSQFAPKFSLFGNYKPKIFSGQDKANPSANNAMSNGSTETREPNSSTNSKDRESKPSVNEHFIVPTFTDRAGGKDNGTSKTTGKSNIKPKENFILMGDKDKPLILETGDELPDELPGDDNGEETVVKESTNAMEQSNNVYVEPSEVGKPDPKEEQEIGKMEVDDVEPINPSYEKSNYVQADQLNEPKMSQTDGPMEIPYIPPPDYDEEVLTIDMPDEEDSHEAHPSEMKGLSSRRVYRVYQGDDFGQYLQDEDSIYQTPSARSTRRDLSKRQPKRPKVKKQNKTSKSITGTISRAIFGSSQNEDTQNRRTIHDVSYGNSKMGDSKRKPNGVQGSRTNGRYYRANDVHSPNNNRQSHYEEFLNSRHTKSGSLESTSDSDMDTGDDNRNTRNHYLTTTGAYSSPNKYIKKNGIWEKLTLRFRRLSRGEVGTVN